ncbi:hypothetical protein TNCV_382621 [Trichonephila clavipes]|nr:hypothetical protein TNCV_382621 [Trichonephila clavipes]
MSREINFILVCLHPPRSPTREAVCRSSGKTRHGAYLKYTQNIMLQHQGEDPTGKPDTPLSAALTLQQCLFGDSEERYHQPIDRSGLTLPPVYSEAWAKDEHGFETVDTEDEVLGIAFSEDRGFRYWKGGQIMFVMFGSVWVAVDIDDGLVA